MNTQNKTFTPVPDGDTTVRTMGSTTKTYGDTSKNSILDARWVEQSMAYGAFPMDETSGAVSSVPSPRKK